MALIEKNRILESQLAAMKRVAEETNARNLQLQSVVVNLEGEKQQQQQQQSKPLGRKRFGDLAPSTVKKTRSAIKEKFADSINNFASNRGLRLEKLILQDGEGERLEVQVEPEHTYANLTKGEKKRVELASRWKDVNRIPDRVYASAKNVSYLPPASHVKKFEEELNQQLQPIQQVVLVSTLHTLVMGEKRVGMVVKSIYSQVGGNMRGGRVDLKPEVERMVQHQIRVGGLVEGDTAIVKVGGDGTSITKKENATVHTATLSNSKKALQIATVSIVMGKELYEVSTSLLSF